MSKRELVHRLLREAAPRGVTTAEFIEVGCGSRFGARVQELRDAGHLVDSKRLRSGSYLYTLRLPSAVPAEVGAVEPPQLFEAAAPAPANALSWGEAA